MVNKPDETGAIVLRTGEITVTVVSDAGETVVPGKQKAVPQGIKLLFENLKKPENGSGDQDVNLN
jgi:hypothetical protein